MSRLRIALIGAGHWGRHHARIYATRPDTTLCAVVGRSERTHALAANHGAPFYSELATMLATERPDLVAISLPYLQQAAVTRQVLASGYPVFTEKPLATSVVEARELLDLAAARKLFFAINFNHRYARPFQLARQAIDAGRVGEPSSALWRFGGAWDPGHPYGTLIESLCHGFDMLEHLVGPVRSVLCEMTDKTGAGFRSVALSLGFANRAVAVVLGTYDSSFEYPRAHYFELNGERGRLLVDDTFRRYAFNERGKETSEVWEAGIFNDGARQFGRMMEAHVDELVSAFVSGKPPPVPALCGLRALEIAEAAIESHQSGRRVVLK